MTIGVDGNSIKLLDSVSFTSILHATSYSKIVQYTRTLFLKGFQTAFVMSKHHQDIADQAFKDLFSWNYQEMGQYGEAVEQGQKDTKSICWTKVWWVNKPGKAMMLNWVVFSATTLQDVQLELAKEEVAHVARGVLPKNKVTMMDFFFSAFNIEKQE